jgi:hypothetical protein
VKKEKRNTFMSHLKAQMHRFRDRRVVEEEAALETMTEKKKPKKAKQGWTLGKAGEAIRGKIASWKRFWTVVHINMIIVN